MKGASLVVIAALVGASLALPSGKVVYGVDDRRDWYEVSPAEQTFSRNAIVALMSPGTVGSPNGDGIFTGPASSGTLDARYGLCDGQLYGDQPTAAFCSGTLIAADRVLTAGHCIDSCNSGTMFVFDYLYNAAGVLETIDTDDVYSCRRVLSVLSGGQDYAVVQLDRPVVGRTPATLTSSSDPVAVGELLNLAGFPSGLPMKFHLPFQVSVNRANTLDYFHATCDTFGGNSGSGTWNADGEIVGILVRGLTDYVTADGCTIVNVIECDEPGCAGTNAESLSYAYNAFMAMPECEIDGDCGEGATCDTSCEGTGCVGWCDREPEVIGPIACGEAVEGDTTGAPNAVGNGAGEHWYTFSLSSTTDVTFDSCGSGYDTYLRVMDTDGNEVVGCDDCGDCGYQTILDATLGAGDYFLVVEGYSNDEGDYTVSFICGGEECQDNNQGAIDRAGAFGIEISGCADAAAYCTGPFASEARRYCPATCGHSDNDEGLAALAAQFGVGDVVSNCEDAVAYLGPSACTGQFGSYMVEYCPCTCVDLALGGFPEKKEEQAVAEKIQSQAMKDFGLPLMTDLSRVPSFQKY